MKIIYTAGPITTPSQNDRWEFHMTARKYAFQIWKRGHAALCPHLNTMLMDDPEIPSGTFYDGDLEMIKRCCDGVLMLPGWRDSKGSVAEWKFAKELGIPIFFTDNLKRLWRFLDLGEVEAEIKVTTVPSGDPLLQHFSGQPSQKEVE